MAASPDDFAGLSAHYRHMLLACCPGPHAGPRCVIRLKARNHRGFSGLKNFPVRLLKIGTPKERAKYVVYWREKFKELEELIKTEGYDVLAPEDLIDHSRMRRFLYDTASILRLVKDVLRPRDFDEFVKYGFADPGKPTA
jgi:hypothetical protein